MTALKFDNIHDAVRQISDGRPIVVLDDEDRENEGDLIIAAEDATAEMVNFFATHGRGLICLALTGEQLNKIDVPQMPRRRMDGFGKAFSVSIEASSGITTGISAADRAKTIAAAISPTATPNDVSYPGHIFPLRANDGGLRERHGHTEAGVELARLAGKRPAAVICEIMNPDGSMARGHDLRGFCDAHGLLMINIADLLLHMDNITDRVEGTLDCAGVVPSGVMPSLG